MLPLTKEELKSYQDAKVCYICGMFSSMFSSIVVCLLIIKIIEKLETMVILQVNIEVQHIVHVI